jgi:adenosine deaminase
LEAHPVTTYWERGVNMTISSDDPPFFRTTLTDELRHVVRLAGLTRDDLGELQRRAARNSFAPPEVKAQLIAEIDAWATAG